MHASRERAKVERLLPNVELVVGDLYEPVTVCRCTSTVGLHQSSGER